MVYTSSHKGTFTELGQREPWSRPIFCGSGNLFARIVRCIFLQVHPVQSDTHSHCCNNKTATRSSASLSVVDPSILLFSAWKRYMSASIRLLLSDQCPKRFNFEQSIRKKWKCMSCLRLYAHTANILSGLKYSNKIRRHLFHFSFRGASNYRHLFMKVVRKLDLNY